MPSIAIGRARIARCTTDLAVTRSFYEHVIGLPVVADFVDHDGFDGVVFALSDRMQFELVKDPAGHAPTPTVEDLLVLSLDEATTGDVVRRLVEDRVNEVEIGSPTVNPYWWRAGARVFVDPDGYRVLLVPSDAL